MNNKKLNFIVKKNGFFYCFLKKKKYNKKSVVR